MTPINLRPAERGMAMVVVLSMVVMLTVLVSFAITMSNQDRGQAGREISNASVNAAAETSLQYARSMFGSNYLTSHQWGDYLALSYAGIPDAGSLTSAHPELVVPGLPAKFNCVVFARDDIDEVGAVNNPAVDNNLRIFVGAVCQTPDGKTAEISAPLEYNPTSTTYSAQGAGGTQGTNNYVRLQGYR